VDSENATRAVTVTVVAVSTAPCSGRTTWETAAAWLGKRLEERFGSRIRFRYVELFSPESFALPAVLEAIEQGKHQLPIVLVDERIVLSGTKLNEGVIARHINE
jgi:disulfide oxidoreductase YuzD